MLPLQNVKFQFSTVNPVVRRLFLEYQHLVVVGYQLPAVARKEIDDGLEALLIVLGLHDFVQRSRSIHSLGNGESRSGKERQENIRGQEKRDDKEKVLKRALDLHGITLSEK